jgi:4-hydroxy-tetrahydrodipicolinate synthase
MLTQERCASVLVVSITPRTADGSVDLEGARSNVRFLREQGVDFAMPMCGTGLVYDATLEEFEAVVGAFMDAASGSDMLVVPGIGPGYGRSLEMGHIARSLGVDGVMIMPIVGPASERGVRSGLRMIAEKTALPTILYQRRLDVMPVDQVIELCGLDEVVGLKYAVDDIASFERIAEAAAQDAAMICGMAEDPCVDYLAKGAVGFSSGMANFVPLMSLEILGAFTSGNVVEAERLRQLMVPFEDFRGENGARYSGSLLHAAMEQAGLAGGPVIPFAEDVATDDLPRLQAMLELLFVENGKLTNSHTAQPA